MTTNSTAIGIDLGTTNSCVGVVRNGFVEIIANEMGHRITPSFVAFTESERLVGDAAKEQAAWNPENTLFDVKRLIGRAYDDVNVQKLINQWPFSVKNYNGNPKIDVQYLDQRKEFTAEEISSMVLMKLKEVAETYLGCEIKNAVITVPAYFNDSQRQATIDAGKIAGLNVLAIINEPTAAAIAYGVDIKSKNSRNILIFDFGGGTFDVVILKIDNNVNEVLAVNGDTFLGGGDIDSHLMNHFIAEFKKKHGIDIEENYRALGKLRKVCEKVKCNLSSSMRERVQIESLSNGVDLNTSISRLRFEELCSETFMKTLVPVENVLFDAKLSKDEIDDIVLVGGSTRIPKIQELLQNYFKGKTLNKTINADEAVAYGAAFHAAVLSGESSIVEKLFIDVTPLSLGVNIEGEITSRIINRNTKIPCTETKRYVNTVDFQKRSNYKIYEGERTESAHNHLLGNFMLENIKQAPRGETKMDVTFEIDRNGILHASAIDVSTGSRKSITITSNKGRLNKEDIRCMMVEAEQFKKDQEEHRDNLIVKGDLESYCIGIKLKIESKRSSLSGDDTNPLYNLYKICDEVIHWLDEDKDTSTMHCRAKKSMLQNVAYGLL